MSSITITRQMLSSIMKDHTSSSVYCAVVHSTTLAGHAKMKVGIFAQAKSTEHYVHDRYSKHSVHKWGKKFPFSLDRLKKSIEEPYLEVLRNRPDICEIVCGQKEHFWVREDRVATFVEFFKTLVKRLSRDTIATIRANTRNIKNVRVGCV